NGHLERVQGRALARRCCELQCWPPWRISRERGHRLPVRFVSHRPLRGFRYESASLRLGEGLRGCTTRATAYRRIRPHPCNNPTYYVDDSARSLALIASGRE